MQHSTHALAEPGQVEQLADQLTALADVVHTRLMRALRSRGTTVPPGTGLTQEQAQALFADEVALRQQANALYADAAAHVIDGLAVPQRAVMALTSAARDSLRQVQQIQDGAAVLLAALLLASAVVGGKAEAAVKALVKLEQQIAKLQHDTMPTGTSSVTSGRTPLPQAESW